jgi:hypothetical protein
MTLETRTEIKLQVPHFQRVTSAMLGKTAPKIGDRVDELVGDIQKKIWARRG